MHDSTTDQLLLSYKMELFPVKQRSIHFFSTDVATIRAHWHAAVQLLLPYGHFHMHVNDGFLSHLYYSRHHCYRRI